MKKTFVCFCDGSCRGNPGHAGSGVFGYTFIKSDKYKNHKHPYKDNLYFTEDGIVNEKNKTPIEVIDIYEAIVSISDSHSTNNEAELVAIITALEKAKTIEELENVTIFTDSNYIVSAFNENIDKWKANNWKRIDNKLVIHINEWKRIDEIHNYFKENNVNLTIKWVKGHSDSYGNYLSDLYSIIGSNASRQITSTDRYLPILDLFHDYNSFKNLYAEKDFTMFFKNLYFSSAESVNIPYYFLSSSDNESIIGKRNNSSIYLITTNTDFYIVNNLKSIFKAINRDYIVPCCIKLNKLEKERDIYRLMNMTKLDNINMKMEYIISKHKQYKNSYTLVNQDSIFMHEIGSDFPFIVNANNLFNKLVNIIEEENDNIINIDITNLIINNGKLTITNKDKNIDISDIVKEKIRLKQKPILKIGYDIPNYLSLKSIEKNIKNVYISIEVNDSNFCTIYTVIITDNRKICSINISDKYLKI